MNPPGAPHLLDFDRFDRRAFEDIAASAGLDRLGAQGERLLPGFSALIEDTFYAFYKGDARLRPVEALPPSARVPHRLLARVMDAPRFGETRDRAMLDPVAAARAARAVGERLLRLVRRDDLLLDREVLDAHRMRAAEQALTEVQARRAALEAMVDEAAADGADPGPDRLKRRMLEVELDTEIELRQQALDGAGRRAAQMADELPRDLMRRLTRAVDALPRDLMALDAEVEQFGRELGGGARLDARQRLALGDRLARSEKLRKLAALVGAFRRMARRERRRKTPRRGPEVYAVERGRDVGRLLAGELAALRHPLLRRDVRRRFVEGALLQYGLRGDDDRGRGPMVICLDGSGSMRGPRELWSKAVTLTLADRARRQGRACRAIVFDAGPEPFARELVPPRPPGGARRLPDSEAVVEFAEHFPGGGTDFVPPLEAALATLGESRYRRGDIVFVTDGEAQVPPAFEARFAAEKARLGFRVVGVLVDVGRARGETLARLADEVHRVSELTGDAAMQVMGSIR